MTELGYKEGRNVAYDFHNAKGDQQALIYLADKIVQNKPTLIVTTSTSDTIPVAKATKESQIPVVFLSAGNPLALVKSYQSSGNNLTGIGTPAIELAAKRMEILKELVPGIKRVFSLVNPGGSNYEDYRQITNEAAEKMKLKLSKEARACLFVGLFFIAVFAVPRAGILGLPRYDVLLLIALAYY